jgi:hypothetical protein
VGVAGDDLTWGSSNLPFLLSGAFNYEINYF